MHWALQFIGNTDIMLGEFENLVQTDHVWLMDLDEVEHVLPITVSRFTHSVWNKQFWWPFGAP